MAKAYAAALTPLRDGGNALDEDAFAPYVAFLQQGGVDGILALGTTGEGILLGIDERQRAAELFLDGPLDVIVHCGAQTTVATVELARHAAEREAAGVAVIAPPYFALDDLSLLAHFEAAANACAPLPFYVYEFRARAGYSVPISVIERLRERVDNLAGLKVSNRPFADVEPYLLNGLEVFVGFEEFVPEGMRLGAAGTVSGLASVYPDVVSELVRTGNAAYAATLREGLERFPFHAAAKIALAARGVPIREDVRRPLRRLTENERLELTLWLASS
ncbi:MAG: dihydrodipicolinate synthase family protein [Gaiellaceae bacterium]